MSGFAPSPGYLGTFLVVAVGTSLLVAAAAFGAALCRSVQWQRVFWQIAILGVLTLLAAEATGLAGGLVRWWQLATPSAHTPFFRASPAAATSRQAPGRGNEDADADYHNQETLGDNAGERNNPADPDPIAHRSRVRRDEFSAIWSGTEPAADSLREVPTAGDVPFGENSGWGSDVGDDVPEHLPLRIHSSPSEGPLAQVADGSAVVCTPRDKEPPWGRWLMMVWGLGALVLGVREAVTHGRLLRFRQRQRRMDDVGLRRRVQRLASRLGWRRHIDLLVSSQLTAPIAFGIVRPALVLPADFLGDFEPAPQDAILAHEIAHLAAGDPRWQLLADLAAALLWWHPAVWWARRRWREVGELAADEASLLVPQGAGLLAAGLVSLARRMESGSHRASLAMAGPCRRSGLERRVVRLLELSPDNWRPAKRGWKRMATVTLAVAFVCVAISCTAWARTRAPVAEGATTMKVFVNSWRQSLAAVTLAAFLGPAPVDGLPALAAEAEGDVPQSEVQEREEAPRERGQRSPEARAEREREEAPRERGQRSPEARAEREREETPRERGQRSPEARAERERERGEEDAEAQKRRWAARRGHLQERAEEIRRRLKSLQPDQEAEARELKHALEQVEVQLHQLKAQAVVRERLQKRLEELKAAQRQARAAGKMDEAERLGRQARELLQRREAAQPERPAFEREAAEVQRRLRHVRVAIDNLRAAGLHDQADALERDAERLLRRERPAAPVRARQPDAVREAPPATPHLERVVRELHGQVQELRQQMDEIRRHLKESSEPR